MKRDRTQLQGYTSEIARIFKKATTKHEAHEQSRSVLVDMSGNPACLRAALSAEIERPGGLNTRHYPTVAFPIEHNPHFSLVANCFLPLPSGETDVTVNSVHHHGHMLLTTVTTFGPGYGHCRFTTPKLLDADRDLFSMELIDRMTYGMNQVAFVDAQMPHAVLFPRSLSVTFALWSSRHEVTWRDHLKRVAAIEAQRDRLRKVAKRLRIADALRLNIAGYFDYYPVPNGFKGMRERIQFRRGPNTDYLYTLFHILQQTGNEDLAPSEELLSRLPIDEPGIVQQLVHDLRRGTPVVHRFSEGLHWLDHMNFKIQEVDRVLETLSKSSSNSRSAIASV